LFIWFVCVEDYMDLFSTLTLFATILGIGALVGGALGFVFAHDRADPRRRLKRSLITGGTLVAVLIIFLLQYMQAPASSLLTLIPQFPFPGSTLHACLVGIGDLPHGTKATIDPSPDPAIAGVSLTIRGGSALSGPMTTAAVQFDRVNLTTTRVHASNSSQGIEDVEARLARPRASILRSLSPAANQNKGSGWMSKRQRKS
jgi:hypothetical protein